MPEHHDPTTPRAGLHLPADDPAAPAVEALRATVGRPVVASAELARFLADPAGAGVPDPRSEPVTVVRLPIRRAGRIAVATGAALAIAALGGVAVAATGGPGHGPALVQQDDPSDTTTSSTSSSSTTEPSETETTEPSESETTEPSETGTHTPNATAFANHHDGVGEDDTHADVNGGGDVDHRAEHSPTARPTHPAPPTGVGTGAPTGVGTGAPAGH